MAPSTGTLEPPSSLRRQTCCRTRSTRQMSCQERQRGRCLRTLFCPPSRLTCAQRQSQRNQNYQNDPPDMTVLASRFPCRGRGGGVIWTRGSGVERGGGKPAVSITPQNKKKTHMGDWMVWGPHCSRVHRVILSGPMRDTCFQLSGLTVMLAPPGPTGVSERTSPPLQSLWK